MSSEYDDDNTINLEPEDILASDEVRIGVREAKLEEGDNLYIINTSDFDGETQRGEIGLKYKTEDGQQVRYKIPDTWIPKDIGLFQKKEKWLRDPGFNSLLDKGYIAIISTPIAESILNHPESKEEIKRIQLNERKLQPHLENTRRQTNKAASEAREKYKAVDSVRTMQIEATSQKQNARVSPRVSTVMNNQDTSEQQKLASLKSFKAQIQPVDIDFIMKSCGRNLPRIKAWAIEHRNRM